MFLLAAKPKPTLLLCFCWVVVGCRRCCVILLLFTLVSSVQVTDYSHGSTDLLAIQIDAAINGGNSGGPVFNRSCQCVGIAFQV